MLQGRSRDPQEGMISGRTGAGSDVSNRSGVKYVNERLDELEKEVEARGKQDSQDTPAGGQTDQPQQQVEDQVRAAAETPVRAAAETYYHAATTRDWGYTYSHLDSQTRSAFTEDEWFAKNDWLADNGSATYAIQSVEMDDSAGESTANVAVLLTFGDGSTTLRNTFSSTRMDRGGTGSVRRSTSSSPWPGQQPPRQAPVVVPTHPRPPPPERST